jgi:hypothetical protein
MMRRPRALRSKPSGKELGIAVHHKHNDATLLKKIDDALKEPARVLDQA